MCENKYSIKVNYLCFSMVRKKPRSKKRERGRKEIERQNLLFQIIKKYFCRKVRSLDSFFELPLTQLSYPKKLTTWGVHKILSFITCSMICLEITAYTSLFGSAQNIYGECLATNLKDMFGLKKREETKRV